MSHQLENNESLANSLSYDGNTFKRGETSEIKHWNDVTMP